MLKTGGTWGFTGSMTSLMFFWAMHKQFFPYHLQVQVEKYVNKLVGWLSNSVHITFNEYTGDGLKRSEAYNSIRNYLSSKSTARAKRLKANESRDSKSLVLSLDDHEAVEDEFDGVKVKWSSNVTKGESQSSYKSRGGNGSEANRFFTLSFDRRHREMITESYLEHVLRDGREIELRNRERKLYTNNSRQDWVSWKEGKWSNVPFQNPATFETLAMDPVKKEGIKKDLIKFSKAKDYYRTVGKPWRRGYLLFGPPGTGKSTMISAMANFLDYDVYDLELTTVSNNLELKRLLLDTTGKSIIVIEDIDCSLGLMGQKRKKKEEEDDEEEDEEEEKTDLEKIIYGDRNQSKVTLSGLLNALDGLWSSCSDEKIMVFTTNFVDKLDPALIRRGRMDNHIEMSYCRFEAFKVLAKNYLQIKSHDLYGDIKILLEETDMSPADVAENLMPKSDEEDADICLKRLVQSLEEEKEKTRKLAEEEEKKKKGKKIKKKKKTEEGEKKKDDGEIDIAKLVETIIKNHR